MNIELPTRHVEQLNKQAVAAGYENVEAYVAYLLAGLAEHPTAADIFAPLSEDELAASLATIDESRRQFEAGEGLSLEEAERRTLALLDRRRP